MDDDSLIQKRDALAAVRIPEYRNLLLGRFSFIMGLRMLSTVVGWWVYELTDDPFAIGLVGLSEFVPAFLFALYAGHVIDVSEKRGLLLKGVAAYFTCAVALLFLSSSYTSSKMSNQWIAYCIYGVIFISGIVRSFTGPIFQTMIANIVPRNTLQNATAWSQGTWLSASVSGHAIGGLLIASLGIHNTFIVIVCLVAMGFYFLSHVKKKPPVLSEVPTRTWTSVMEGLQFVFRTKELLGAITLDLFAVLFGGAVALVPVYARDILKVGAQGFGFLNAAVDIGAIISVIILTAYPLAGGQGRKLFYAVAGFGVCIIVFGVSKIYWISFLVLLLAGVLDGISVVIRGTIMQLKTPDHVRGRVMSVNSMFVNSSNELGQFESGAMARVMGVQPSVVFGGVMTLLVVIITWIKAPGLRKMQY